MCRIPWSEALLRSSAQEEADPTVYHTMNGPSEFHITGVIKEWDITQDLHRILVPTLLVSGRHDEATPAVVGQIHERIAGSQWVVLDRALEPSPASRRAGWIPRSRGRVLGDPRLTQRPRQMGSRPSANARGPSFASSLSRARWYAGTRPLRIAS